MTMDVIDQTKTETGLAAREVGAISALGREAMIVRSSIEAAKAFPRDEQRARLSVLESCSRPRFAEDVEYQFKRGSKKDVRGNWVDNIVRGPTVYLAKEAKRCWGNIRTELAVLNETEDKIHIAGRAIDLETNNTVSYEDEFRKLIQRKVKGETVWVKPDERDVRELVNRRGAILVRNAVLDLLPPDLIDEAIDRARETLTNAVTEDKPVTPRAIADTLAKFEAIGVTRAMVEAWLKHPAEKMTSKERAALKPIYNAISEGHADASEYFTFAEGDINPSEVRRGPRNLDDLASEGEQ